ncbi:hypothetical protein O3P69_004404 [Scylla paramamosain]|uniref:Chitin-binding type-2 domain-containing protein n=1 Tax=Scylla paramamosain TaxID=85552 RepID=A0AAW0UE74_SCYPA
MVGRLVPVLNGGRPALKNACLRHRDPAHGGDQFFSREGPMCHRLLSWAFPNRRSNKPFFDGNVCQDDKRHCCACKSICTAEDSTNHRMVPDYRNCTNFFLCLDAGIPDESTHGHCPVAALQGWAPVYIEGQGNSRQAPVGWWVVWSLFVAVVVQPRSMRAYVVVALLMVRRRGQIHDIRNIAASRSVCTDDDAASYRRVPDFRNCTNFYECVDPGMAQHHGHCPEGNFDLETRDCNEKAPCIQPCANITFWQA